MSLHIFKILVTVLIFMFCLVGLMYGFNLKSSNVHLQFNNMIIDIL